jgi:hypothetical protein
LEVPFLRKFRSPLLLSRLLLGSALLLAFLGFTFGWGSLLPLPWLTASPSSPSCFVRISFKAVLSFFFGDPAFNLPAAVVSPSLAFDLIQFWLALKPQLFPSSGWTLARLA